MDAKELEDAIENLIDYLQFKRNEYLKEGKPLNDPSNFLLTPLIENRPVLKTRFQILQIIDTTLLKCYLKTKENLVPFFLRRDQSFFHLEESERLLQQHNKISELVILYEKKEAHEKAFTLLTAESTKTSSPLVGQKFLIDYMKKLGNRNIGLILQYAKGVIEADADRGMKIFTGDLIKIDEILSRRARHKEKNFAKKNSSVSNIKSVIGNEEWTHRLSVLLKINQEDREGTGAENSRKTLLKNELNIEDDEDDEQLKTLDREQVCMFLKEKIDPKLLR